MALPEYVFEVGLAVLLEHACERAIAGGDALALHEHWLLPRGFSRILVREDAGHRVYETCNAAPAMAHLFYSWIGYTSNIGDIHHCNCTTSGIWIDWVVQASVIPNASVSQHRMPSVSDVTRTWYSVLLCTYSVSIGLCSFLNFAWPADASGFAAFRSRERP